jgi:hypothetical protein
MKTAKAARVLLVIGLLSGATLSAHAAGSYMLTCDAAKGATLNMTLTGFSFKVTGAEEAATGMAAGKRSNSNFELTIKFAAGRDYETLVSMVEDNEIFRSCKLVDGTGGGVTATDNWNQMSTAKGKNKSKASGNIQKTNSSGALEWILTNATVTSVTATGSENSTGAPESSIQATIEAQKFSFTM